MVKSCVYFLCFWWIGMGILEAAPVVEASIDSMTTQAHFPLEGTITITHSKEEKIDPKSFTMEGKSLETSLTKNVKISEGTIVTFYSFQLPAKDKGLYVLPPISVKIGNQTYQTISSSYEVKSETAVLQSAPSSTSTPTSPIIFRLEATNQGPSSLYPGERTKLFYRISYNRSVDLTRSILPMVHPAHFQKVGDVQIKDYQTQDVTVQELTQEVEASDLGTFQLGPSSIEGYAYTMQAGQKVYDPNLLKAEAPVVTLEVKPLPASQQPASFTGALGKIQAEATLQSSNSVSIGENIQVQVQIQGVSNLEALRLPVLQCQPGFSGFFQTSDLPPLAEVKDGVKIFQVELRPLTSLIKQIPSIEVSSFDSSTGKYVIQRTAPLLLTVEPSTKEKAPSDSVMMLTKLPTIGKWPTPALSPLEIKGFPFKVEEMKSSGIEGYWTFWLLPFGLAFLFLQKRWHDKLQKREKPVLPKSEKLFQQALKTDSFKSLKSLHLLEQAFWHRLWERGIVQQGNFEIKKIPDEKNIDKIHSFLFQLQALQYSSNKEFDPIQIKQDALYLFKKL